MAFFGKPKQVPSIFLFSSRPLPCIPLTISFISLINFGENIMKLLEPLGIDKQSEINPKVRLIDVVSYY